MFPGFKSVPHTFLGVEQTPYAQAKTVIVPVPLEFSTSYRKGTREGPQAIITASKQVELYDCEEDFSPYESGIYTCPEMAFSFDRLSAFADEIEKWMDCFLLDHKFPILLGGEHSLSVPAVRALKRVFHDLSVLQLDAHADFRESYQGNPYSHACVGRRMAELAPVIQIGVRSMCAEEKKALQQFPEVKTIKACEMEKAKAALDNLSPNVYITIDVDVLDPAFMPSTGTPEPGGLSWEQLNDMLRVVCTTKNVVGLDVSELSPLPNIVHPEFAIAKLVYRCVGWKFLKTKGGSYAQSLYSY